VLAKRGGAKLSLARSLGRWCVRSYVRPRIIRESSSQSPFEPSRHSAAAFVAVAARSFSIRVRYCSLSDQPAPTPPPPPCAPPPLWENLCERELAVLDSADRPHDVSETGIVSLLFLSILSRPSLPRSFVAATRAKCHRADVRHIYGRIHTYAYVNIHWGVNVCIRVMYIVRACVRVCVRRETYAYRAPRTLDEGTTGFSAGAF